MKLFNNDWDKALYEVTADPRFINTLNFIKKERETKEIYPPEQQLFRSLQLTGLSKTKVVILGQDPYHGEGQADGLAFSVPAGTKQPPSLRNIIKKLAMEYNLSNQLQTPLSTDLSPWSREGVLLLNAVLTVEKGKPKSHSHLFWQNFTDIVIKTLSEKKEPVVFILWGNDAKQKAKLIDATNNLLITGLHPSPLSAHRGFFEKSYFTQANEYLIQTGQRPINWKKILEV